MGEIAGLGPIGVMTTADEAQAILGGVLAEDKALDAFLAPIRERRAAVVGSRRLHLGNFLLAQARRTLHEHWYDDNPLAEPYYRMAGRSFLGDARGLAPLAKWSRQ